MGDLTDAALELASQGFRVFPVGPDKSPRTPNGFYDATTKPEVIRAWDWDGGSMIGAAVSPGTVIIDVDPRNGGSDTLKLFKENGRTFPPTRVVRTKSGGFHYYFNVPEDAALRAKLGPGIDIKRAGKGYVVVPPSPGYALIRDGQVDAPDWLLEEIAVDEAETEAAAGEPSEAKFFPWEEGTPYGMAALEREMGRLITAPEGDRNNSLNRAAFALSQLAAGGEISRKAALKALTEAAPRIGLGLDEARGTIESGWKAGAQAPRQAPPPHERMDIEAFAESAGGGLDTPGASDVGPMAAGAPPAEAEARFWVDWDVDEPELPFYAHPILPKNAYVLVYGATEASKSMVWLAICTELSHRGHRCSFYSLENPPHTDRDRLRRWRPNKSTFRLTNEPIDLNDARQLAAMVKREREWGADVIVIDTYSHAFNSRSEDGNAKAIEFARRIRHLMHEVGCSVVLIDHTGYMQKDEPRDASAKRQQVDVAILMQKAGEWRPGQSARFTMENKKAARFANPFHLTGEIKDVTDGDIRGLALGWVGGKQPRWEDAG
jgi:hypothetical protein